MDVSELGTALPDAETYALLEKLSADPDSVANPDVPKVLAAVGRQLNRLRALQHKWVMETALVGPWNDPYRRLVEIDEGGVGEVRFATGMSLRRTTREVSFAVAAMVTLPVLHEAMLGGALDEAHARVFVNTTEELHPDTAATVIKDLLGDCMEMTLPQLEQAIIERAMALDPEWMAKLEEAARRQATVIARRNRHTVDIVGRFLPPDQAAAGIGRLDHLVRSAKADGDPRMRTELKVLIYLGLLSGQIRSNDDTLILNHLKATRPEPTDGDAGGDAGKGKPGGGGGGGGGRGGPRWPGRPSPAPPAPAGSPAPETEPDTAASEAAEPEIPGPDVPEPDVPEPDVPEPVAPAAESPAVLPFSPGIGVELKVKLSTLLGLDVHPGQLAGLGPISAAAMRELVAEHSRGRWIWVLCDEDGYLFDLGVTRARPHGYPARDQRDRSTVEIRVPGRLLTQLLTHGFDGLPDPGLGAAWAPVLAEIAGLHEAGSEPVRNPRRRFPDTALRRQVKTAIAHCVAPFCHRPSSRCEVDHFTPHAESGDTVFVNLGPECHGDHRLKTHFGFTLRRTGTTTLEWTTRAGHTYPVRIGPLITDLPDPAPHDGGRDYYDFPLDEDWRTSWEPPRRFRRRREPAEVLNTPPPPPRPVPTPPAHPPQPEEPPF